MTRARPFLLALTLLTHACGGASLVHDERSPRNPLACAGRTLEDRVPIPELGPLPSGDPVTAGIAITCSADGLSVMDWGPDSSANYVIGRPHAMEIWRAFEEPATLDARRLRVLLLVEDVREDHAVP